jgi:hypothetical protein
MGASVSTGDFADHMSNSTDEATGHPADRSEKLANRKSGKTEVARFGGLETVFTFTCGPSFQLVIDLMSDSAGLFNRLFH